MRDQPTLWAWLRQAPWLANLRVSMPSWRVAVPRLRRAPRQALGQQGEAAAARFLRQQGYRIITRNFRNRWGEIDIVARHGNTLVFVEVKSWYARHAELAQQDPSEAVDLRKQARLVRTALGFLKQFGLLEQAARFDVVSVLYDANQRSPRVKHLIDAFRPTDLGQFFV